MGAKKPDDWDAFIRDLQELQMRALKLDLPITARKINWAVQASGWERAGDTARANRGERA